MNPNEENLALLVRLTLTTSDSREELQQILKNGVADKDMFDEIQELCGVFADLEAQFLDLIVAVREQDERRIFKFSAR